MIYNVIHLKKFTFKLATKKCLPCITDLSLSQAWLKENLIFLNELQSHIKTNFYLCN